jgi:ribosomal protein S18 acetylase RimI-like enzyme
MILIRKYRLSDRSSVENIQFETWNLGKSASLLADDEKRFHEEIKYYLEKEPESCFVAEDKGKVVGYLLGCLDDKNHEESINAFLFKSIGLFFQLPFMSKKDRRHWWGVIKVVFIALLGKSEDARFKTPPDSGHIHINLLPQARGFGVGTKLLKEFFKYARSKKVKIIHADSWQTRLNPNKNFWMKNGFKEYCSVKTAFWRTHYPEEDIRSVCYVKKI